MSLQYITDEKGQTTGVFIPIEEWNNMKSQYSDLEKDIPEWHKREVSKRMQDYRQSPEQAQDFNKVIDEIEKNL